MVLGAEEADVGAAGTLDRLHGVADQRALADRALAAIEQHVRRLLRLQVVVVLDVVGADLDVADLAGDNLDAALLAVADMVAVDVGLVQVDAVEEDADAAVVIDVTIADIDVAAAADDV